MSSCTLSYLNKTNLPLSEKERLTELHNQIFEELKQSKYLRKYKGQLVMPKHGYDVRWASADIKRVNERYGGKVVSVIYDRSDKYFKAMVDVLKSVTPGVKNIFKSNPELADAVYEALGFNDNNFELKENKEAFGKEPHPEGATTYDIFSNGRKIGKIALFNGKNPMIKGLNLNESERNKGLGKALYKWLNYKATLKGGKLYADQEFISPDAQRVWESLNKEGLVDLTGNSPKFNDKQKQQAQQQYSQYLDSIFPDSKVKDIVYHGTSRDFQGFIKGKQVTPKGRTRGGIWFTDFANADWVYKEDNGKVIAALINIKNPTEYNTERKFDELYKEYYTKLPLDKGQWKDIQQLLDNKKGDGLLLDIFDATTSGDIGEFTKQQVVFEPEQIHILGSKQDIDGFKNYVNTQKAISQIDITMQAGNQYFAGGIVFPTYEDAQSFKEKVEQEYVQMEINRLFEAGELQIDCDI
jgi:hypothetical protein